MGAQLIPYEPYHPHIWYTLVVTSVAWFTISLYSYLFLRNQPRARVALISLAIGLPLFAEFGSYGIFLMRPDPSTPLGSLLSLVHMRYLQALPLDSFFAPSVTIAAAAAIVGLLVVSLIRFGLGSARLKELLRLSEPFDTWGYDELIDRLRTIGVAHNLRLPPIRVLPLDQPLAFTIGLLRPRIYVADGLLALLSEEEALAVFCHELGHVYRRDNLWNWLIRLFRDMAWFLPFSHAGWHMMVQSQDEACDKLAVTLTGDPLSLARALVKVVGAWHGSEPQSLLAATPFALARADVRSRVEQMITLSDHTETTRPFALPGAYVLGIGLLVLSVLPALLGS